MNSIHLNDVGVDLRFPMQDGGVVINTSSATLLQIHVQKPSGATAVFTASNLNDGTDGIVHHATQSGEINEFGVWKYQVYAEFGPNTKLYSDIGRIRVLPNI